MINKIKDYNRFIVTVFSVLAVILVAIIVVSTRGLDKESEGSLINYGDGWSDDSGKEYNIEDVRVDEAGNAPVVEKILPERLKDSDFLCIETFNIDLDVYVDGQNIYSFRTKENITGLGYGTAFHEVGLSSSMAKKTITIFFKRSNPNINTQRGHIESIYLGELISYIKMVLGNNLVTHFASVMILFFGIVFVIISFVISDNERLPFDVAALGVTLIITGSWLLVLTNIFQLVSGHIFIIRALDRFLILLAGVPLICFYNSLTHQKSRIFPRIEFWSNIVLIACIFVLRYCVGIDMMYSFTRALIVYFIQIVILTIVMFVRHERYCRRNGIPSGLKYYYIGIVAFFACAFTDYGLYYFKKLFGNSYGTITSIGVFVLVPIIMIQFIRWWTKDRQVIERERFTNRSLQYALSSGSPDESIRLLLEFMGEEFKCKRVAVFEDSHNGRFHGKYAWFDKSLEKKPIDLIHIPNNGVVDRIVNAYKENGNKYTVSDVEAFRDLNPGIYNMLKTYNIQTLVINPLEVDGVVTGLLMLLDIPAELVEEASSVATLTSYFLSQLILRRDDQKRMRTYTYNDSLSGAQNRRAYEEFVSEKLDLSMPFGYMLCRINDLEEISVKDGFKAGDAVVAEAANIMEDVFGSEHVYRMAGSSFVAFGFETDETYFNDDVARFEKNAENASISVSVGSVYCMNGAMDIKTVVKRAGQILRSKD